MSNKTHIFIDGPDGCGKSTICEMLSKKTGYPVIKMERVKEMFGTDHIEPCSYTFNSTISQFSDCNFIVDRGYTSSVVYSSVYGRKANLSYLHEIEKRLNPVIIILIATNEELYKRRPTDEVIQPGYRELVRLEYIELAKRKNYTIIDTTGKTSEEVLKLVETTVYGKEI